MALNTSTMYDLENYRAAGGVMRIMKGALVMMKGLKQNSLYLLQGNTVSGAAATDSSSDIDSDTTKLWHMRLGHMSERGMDVLSEQGLLGSKKIGKLDFCEHCVFGKQYRVKFSRAVHTTKEFFKNEGIVRHRTVRKMPQQNGITERMNRTLLERDRNILSDAGLSGNIRFQISRDVTFDESLMLSKKKELIDAGKDNSIREKVELEVRALDSLPIIPTNKEDENIEVEEPATYKEAIKSMESTQWTIAMSEMIESLYKNQTWELVKPPVGQKIVSCKWVYKKNKGIPGMEDARLLLAMVALYDLELEQLDVKTTFLHGELEEQIFMRQPEGFVIQEAKYVAATEAVKEAFWLKGLVGDLELKQESSTVYCDSQSAIHLTKNQMLHEWTKHIDVRFYFIRDVVSQGTVMVEKIFTYENPADMMTKHIPEIKFKHCLDLIGISSI
ncbi:hypothetical protein RJ639_000066 [Escallonia herrerae]|uniref:Gag-pol polyprotein n=1 Tax=Escallonia herrerae TaxID=1293975 RepID=A0AA89BIJ0_9ASTE|nr:hypothetical protein RJ639_000066 [Escallonia herrerae]